MSQEQTVIVDNICGLVLLDYDGVIVDSAATVLEQTEIFCARHELPFSLTLADLDRLDPLTLPMLAHMAGIPDAKFKAYGRLLFDYLQAHSGEIPLVTGIDTLLSQLSSHYTLGVISANHSAVVKTRLAMANLMQHVSACYGNDHPGGKRTHIADALTRFDIPRKMAWMVGDSVSDIDAAQESGVAALAVSWGWQSAGRLAARKPDQLFHQPHELRNFFDNARLQLPCNNA